MKNFIYHNQIVHHKPCFNLFILHNNLFDNQGSEINKNDIFCTFRHTVFYEIFLPTLLYSLSLSIHALQSSTQTKIKPFYCTEFTIAPVKGFHLVREMSECTTEFSS